MHKGNILFRVENPIITVNHFFFSFAFSNKNLKDPISLNLNDRLKIVIEFSHQLPLPPLSSFFYNNLILLFRSENNYDL